MPPDEGELLFRRACDRLPHGPALEVGTYCGKSAIYLGAAARAVDGTVFTVDHHRGSEENQAGWEHHDPTTVDPDSGRMDTLGIFRRNIARAGLEHHVVAIVGESATVARWWRAPLSLLFIDGGHGVEPAQADFRNWVPITRKGLVSMVERRPSMTKLDPARRQALLDEVAGLYDSIARPPEPLLLPYRASCWRAEVDHTGLVLGEDDLDVVQIRL
jgi:predicted O-methyltransferase YrrM